MNDHSLTRFGLMRHALTEGNLQHRIQGQQDTPIAFEGKIQAQQWARRLQAFSWDRILTSDTGRAVQTAELLNETLGLPIDLEPRLREQDWGRWAGMTIARLRHETPGALEQEEAKGWGFCPPGGEVLEAVWQRSRQALLAAAQKRPGAKILVITHEGVLKSLIYRFNSPQLFLNQPFRIRSGYLHLMNHDTERLHIDKINALKLD